MHRHLLGEAGKCPLPREIARNSKHIFYICSQAVQQAVLILPLDI